MSEAAASSQEPGTGSFESRALRSKHARAGMTMAVATFTMATTSGIQALLYLRAFGVDGRTDGFFAALGLYAIFGLFSQCIRVTSVPLLVGDRPRLRTVEFAAALGLIALPVVLLTWPLAGPLAHALAPGLEPADRAVTEDALPILGGAMVLQLWAAGAATLLAVRDRFHAVAGAYIAGSLTALVTYLAVEGAAAELSLGLSMLAMAIVTFPAMLLGLGVRRPSMRAGLALARSLRLPTLLAKTGLILGRNAAYLAFNGLYVITLAFTSRYDAGDASVLAYSYMFVSYLVAGTGFALGMSRIPDMTRGARSTWRAVLADTVTPGFRYAMLLVAPAVACFVAICAPLAGEVFPSSLGGADVDSMRIFGAELYLWTIAALLVNLLLPAMFALGRARLVNALALPLVVLHVAVIALAGALFGVEGVVGSFFIAPLCYAALLMRAGAGDRSGRLALELAGDAARFTLMAAGAYAVGALAGAALPGAFAQAAVAAGLGTALYFVAVRFAAKKQVQFVIGSLRPRSPAPPPAVQRASARG